MVTYESLAREFEKGKFSARFREKCKKFENNTYIFNRDGVFCIMYHHTDIVSVDKENTYYIENGGWFTRTTLDRMNRYLPIRFWQKNNRWYYTLNGKLIEFTGTCTITQEELREDRELDAFLREAAVKQGENRYERDID